MSFGLVSRLILLDRTHMTSKTETIMPSQHGAVQLQGATAKLCMRRVYEHMA